MTSSLLDLLMRLTVASSMAVIAVLVLRTPLRRLAGPAVAYASWSLVPLAMLAAALPQLKVAPVLVMHIAAPATSTLAAAAVPSTVDWVHWIMLLWWSGVFAMLAWFVVNQMVYVRSLGPLAERDGIVFAECASGPMLLGLHQPRIVVPADFAVRYSADEQTLILAHESMHAARRDPLANGLMALLQCLFWFNPIVHYGAARCRFDQELACDADVMTIHAGQRHTYAAAMLKTQSASAPALATCHWQSSHPLKERIMELKQITPGSTRRLAGRAIIAVLACASVLTAIGVRAAPPAAARSYEIAVKFAEGDNNTTPYLQVKEGEDFELKWDQPPASWSGKFSVTGAAADSVYVKMKITRQNGEVAEPTLLLKLGQPGAVSMGDASSGGPIKIGMTVIQAPAAVAAR